MIFKNSIFNFFKEFILIISLPLPSNILLERNHLLINSQDYLNLIYYMVTGIIKPFLPFYLKYLLIVNFLNNLLLFMRIHPVKFFISAFFLIIIYIANLNITSLSVKLLRINQFLLA